MELFVKICGMCRPDDIEAVAALAPDAMGFNFWPRSPRYIDPDDAADWGEAIPDSIRKVGVFVDEDAGRIGDIAVRVKLDVVQLHGNEAPSLASSLSPSTWKVVHLDRTDAAEAASYPVDAFLVDSYTAESPGGTGKICDWQVARSFIEAADRPVLLAGGLTPGNVREAVAVTAPWGVDVSSGVEAGPGRKSLAKVQSFIEQCRNW
jgi:phosphoribosylanthranilate isomerase